jgi:hypothetical protein
MGDGTRRRDAEPRACGSVLRHVWRGSGDAEGRSASQRSSRSSRRALVRRPARSSTRAPKPTRSWRAGLRRADHRHRRQAFLGLDALDMAGAFMRGDPWFDEPHWQREGAQLPGIAHR